MKYDTGEVGLAYEEWVGESPAVVFLHGLSGSRASELAAEARGGHRAFAYDHRGHGESGRTPGQYTFANFGRDAVAFVEGLVREPCLLVGHSLGGMAALYAAAHARELIRGVFAIDPPLYAPEVELRDERAGFTAAAAQAGRPVQELTAAGQPLSRAETLSKLDPDVLPMLIDRTMFAGWDTDAFLRKIECTVVLEHGDRELGSAISNARRHASGNVRSYTLKAQATPLKSRTERGWSRSCCVSSVRSSRLRRPDATGTPG